MPKDNNSSIIQKKAKAKKDKTSGLKIPSEITSNITNNNVSVVVKEEQHKHVIQKTLISNSEIKNKNNKLNNNKILHKFNNNSKKIQNNKTKNKLDTKIINDKKNNLRLLAIALKQKNNKIIKNNNLESFLI